MANNDKALVKVQVVSNATGSAIWDVLLKRCEEFKLVCTRLNEMPRNKHISNSIERHTIGVLTGLAIMNPLFWIFGIRGVAISLKILEKSVMVVKFAVKCVWATVLKTVKAIAVLGIIGVLMLQDLVKLIQEIPWLFLGLAFILVWCLSQTPVPTC